MSTLLVTLTLLLSSWTQSTTPPTGQEVSSDIEKATVFLSGAQVTRTASVELSEGINQIVFTNLSRGLNERSITISTDQPITLLSMQKLYEEERSTPTLDSLRNQLDEIENQLKFKNAEQQVWNHELNILMENRQLKGENENISAQEIKQAMDYFREKLTEIEKGKLEVQNEIDRLNRQQSEINQQIQTITQNQNRTSGQIAVEIESPRTQTVTFSISYFVNQAGWQPSYDVRVQDIANPLQLVYKANIRQATGIDWNDVEITISSAEPSISTSIPVLSTTYVDFYTPPRARESEELFDQEVRADNFKMAPEATGAVATTTTHSPTAFSFTIRQPYSVPGNGEAKTLAVNEHELPASYQYYAIPKVRKTAYLTARLTDWEDLNLLPGPANLYFGKTFVGQSAIQSDAPGDTLRFSLGKDESISVERNRIREFSEKNFFGNKITETSGWELLVKNNKNQPITLELVDQVPVSTNEDIKVTLENRSGGTFDKTTGRVTWLLKFDPGETAEKQLRYTLEYPSGKTIQRRN